MYLVPQLHTFFNFNFTTFSKNLYRKPSYMYFYCFKLMSTSCIGFVPEHYFNFNQKNTILVYYIGLMSYHLEQMYLFKRPTPVSISTRLHFCSLWCLIWSLLNPFWYEVYSKLYHNTAIQLTAVRYLWMIHRTCYLVFGHEGWTSQLAYSINKEIQFGHNSITIIIEVFVIQDSRAECQNDHCNALLDYSIKFQKWDHPQSIQFLWDCLIPGV